MEKSKNSTEQLNADLLNRTDRAIKNSMEDNGFIELSHGKFGSIMINVDEITSVLDTPMGASITMKNGQVFGVNHNYKTIIEMIVKVKDPLFHGRLVNQSR